ncbi:hypothetical protein ATCC90586_000270 [Pythium insidiosum]|nr:hypothetical protein ATCC90586_000270 [Pythium insidiosum]
MLSRVSRNALRLARRSTNQRFAQVAFFSTEGEEQPAIKNELELSPKVKSVLDQIVELNMIEIFELSSAIQQKFNIPDAAFSMAAGGGGAAPAAEEAKEEKTQFDVKLASFDAKNKIKVIKEIRAITGLGLKEAKELVEGVPSVLKKDLKKDEAEALIAQLKEMDAIKNIVGGGNAKDPKEAQYERAGEMLENSLTKCPRVKFLADIMERMGCKMEAGFFSIVECDGPINGGFHLGEEREPGVRAAALSGDCDWKYEFFRKNFNVAKQHQICTRRRAKLSIQSNPSCQGKEDECLDKVFESCYKDVAPFREIP